MRELIFLEAAPDLFFTLFETDVFFAHFLKQKEGVDKHEKSGATHTHGKSGAIITDTFLGTSHPRK